MKRFIVFVFFASLLFAVETVPRTKTTGDETSKGKTEVVVTEKTRKSKSEKEKDSIIDADSNSVNDQREDDLQKIKWLKSRFRDLFKKQAEESEGSQSKQSRPQKNKRK